MKNRILIIATLAGSLVLSSCEDFLTHENTTSANQETFFDSDEALEAATAPLYNYVWNSFNDKAYYSMGDGRANNITARWSDYIYPYTNFTETALSPGLEDAWGSFYSVVAQSNYAINNIRDYSGPQVSEAAKIQAYAEARFMRGLAYWYIGSLWNKGIIYENTAEQVGNSVVPANRGVDVIEFAIRDLEYAAVNLSKTASDVGRVTRYSAYALLSRMYLSMAGLTTDGEYNGSNIATDFNRGSRNSHYLDMARKAALKVINEGPYSLLNNYSELFAPATCNNNNESIFQLQWLQGSTDAIGWGCNNSMTTYFGWSTMVGEQNWGNATYASYDLVRTYDPQDRIRRHCTIATVGEYYPELNTKNGGYTYNVTETGYDNKCNFKKYVIGKIDDNGQSYSQSSGLNTYMMRLAEVYLNLAEAVLGNNASTSQPEALDPFNAVRKRAGMPELTSITYENIHYERRIEFALEGQYWYDLLRRSYYRQQEVVNYLNNQERNAGYEWDETEACQYAKTSDGTGVSIATSANLTLPISDVDRGRNPLLNNDPVAYEFGAREVTENDLFND
ncbi:RagB/SusD family nutrient uptake outer membrane protein [uncultured Bacteroides sp.]|uniref:RagB/SusD family nutrient uptake outer membrane protein n=1 Tax=uncultured Bacteroides sp. TaxID=162156 RepID=UPI0025D9BD24|nr:RagB/SusD family nutrient uptake outer membrane protein [uncultured Bacteroides sp.]